MASVLVVDDDAHIVRVLSIWLQRHGHDVVAARTGLEALSVFDTDTVDVMITDANMPGLDGEGLVRAVRNDLGLDIPILMLTARCDQDRLSKMVAACDVDIFPKPFLPSQLVSEIDRVLRLTTG
ncbi:MAG: response regulator transcription factor [Dehalococcoidia bacterium]